MEKPDINQYQDAVVFLRDQISYLKHAQKHYSITRICSGLRRCSPSLISNIQAGKRRITEDRIKDIAKVLMLKPDERRKFEILVTGENLEPDLSSMDLQKSRRRKVSSFILNDWINPFVKDALRLKSVIKNFESIYSELSAIANRKRINRSLEFLIKHGYLRRNANGELVESDTLHVLGDEKVDDKIRHFHKQTLELAKKGIDKFPMEERLAQAMIFPVDPDSYQELTEVISEFSEKLKDFSEKNKDSDHRLYQLILHLTPTGESK